MFKALQKNGKIDPKKNFDIFFRELIAAFADAEYMSPPDMKWDIGLMHAAEIGDDWVIILSQSWKGVVSFWISKTTV